MKIALFGITEIKPGRHNLKDPRFDQTDKLVAADKKTYAQVEVLDDTQLLDADAILASADARADLILKDLEFVETRLGREPLEAEKAVLLKIQGLLEKEQFVAKAGLSAEELQAIAAHSFYTNKPIAVATPEDLQNPDTVLLRAFKEGGYICFLTVGGKENRAWPIRQGRRRGRPPGASIPTCKRGSSGPRSSATRISSPRAARPRPSGLGSSGWRPSST